MLQKFLRKSFRRSSKDFKHDEHEPRNNKVLERSQSLPADTLDQDAIKSPSVTSERDVACRKVTFKDSLDSPEKSCMDEKETSLFDGSVLEAFQVGNLSIAEFLQSPHTSPKNSKPSPKRDHVSPKRDLSRDSPKQELPITSPKHKTVVSPKQENTKSLTKKFEKFSNSPKVGKASTFPRKKLSLLDQAHSSVKKKPLDIEAINDSVVDPAQKPDEKNKLGYTRRVEGRIPVDLHLEVQSPVDSPDIQDKSPDSLHGRRLVKSQNSERKNFEKNEKPRFSKSLETLAQQVFGEDYETYLHSASKSPVKFSIIAAKQESLDSCGSNVTRSNSFDSKSSDVHSGSDYLKPHQRKVPPAKKERQKLKKMPHSLSIHNEQRVPITEQRFVRSFDKSAAQEIQQPHTIESWNNELDLRSHSMDGSPCEYNSNSIGSEFLGAINEDEIATLNDSQKRRRAKSLGALKDVYALKTISSPTRRRIPKTDSQIVQIGSFSENDLSASESSFINIHFPPPPPAGDMCDLADPNFDAASFSSYELDDSNDPLISSLMSVVPLPNDPEKLVSVLSSALSEIVTEIVASRRKLSNVIKAIHVHQQILKDQCRQIKSHHKEIMELRRTAYALNNHQMLYRYDKNSKSNSARSSRQSREMVELHYTLDKLLEQCSNMQQQQSFDGDDDERHMLPGEHEYDTLPEVVSSVHNDEETENS